MRIHVDEARCVGAGQCVFAAPEVFDQREEDGVVQVLVEQPAADQLASVQDAVALCPAAVITLSKS